MMNAEEQEYMDYLIHNRTELTNQITRHLDELILLQKKLDIAVRALEEISETDWWWRAKQALKEIDLVGTSMSLAKEEV